MNDNAVLELLEAESFAAKHVRALVQETVEWKAGKRLLQPDCKTRELECMFQRVFPAMPHNDIHDVTQSAIVNAAFKAVLNQKDKQSRPEVPKAYQPLSATMSHAAMKADESAGIIMYSIFNKEWKWPQVRPDDLHKAIIHHEKWHTYKYWIDVFNCKCRGKSKSEIIDELSTVHLVWTEYDDPLTPADAMDKYPLFRIVNNLMLARYATKTIWYDRTSEECSNLKIADVEEARRMLLFKKEHLSWSEAETLLALTDFLNGNGPC